MEEVERSLPGSARPPVIYSSVAGFEQDDLDEGQRETLAPWPQAWRLEEFRSAWIKQICGYRHNRAWQDVALQGNLITRLVIAIERPRELP